MGGTNSARLKGRRLFFSQYRRCAVEPDVAPRNRHDVARFVRAPKHGSLDQIDLDRRSFNPSPWPADARASQSERRQRRKSFGHFKPINSPRFLNDCHEYVFHFTKSGRVELNRLALGVPYQDKSNIGRWSHTRGTRSALPREHVVRPLRNNSKPRERTAAPCDISGPTRRMVHQIAWSVARPIHAGSFSRHWKFCARGAALWRKKIYWI